MLMCVAFLVLSGLQANLSFLHCSGLLFQRRWRLVSIFMASSAND